MIKKFLIALLVLLRISPTWCMHHDSDDNGGGSGIAAILPEVRQIAWSEITQGTLIGHGSFGDVYAGTWRGQDVALKVLQMKTMQTEQIRHDFEKEVHAMWTCQYSRILRLYGVCLEPGHLAMVFERMQGSLHDLIHREALSEDRRLQMAIDIAQGLVSLHAKPVLHRDLKSQNILLDGQGRAKISDFGSAKIRTATATMTRGQLRGTVRWSAPEVVNPDPTSPKPTAASDMYSYGMILWELFTRKTPFATQQNDIAVIFQILQGPPETIPSTCPPLWREIIEGCWQKDPTQRPTAKSVLARLSVLQPPTRPVWLPEEAPDPSELRVEGYACYGASRGDWKKVLQFYQRQPVPGYDVGRVEVIFNPDMNECWRAKRQLLQQRRGNPRYTSDWRGKAQGDLRTEIFKHLDGAAGAHADDNFPDVKLFPVWHGTQRGNLPSLLSAGYGAFCDTDDGYFGGGIYTTLEAAYANMYANRLNPQQSEDGVLILNWGITYSSYPILKQDFNLDETKLAVRIPPGRYDSHFVPVIPVAVGSSVYVPITPPEGHHFTEVVFMEAVQVLPRYLVTLQKSGPGVQISVMEKALSEKEEKERALKEKAAREKAQRVAQEEAKRKADEARIFQIFEEQLRGVRQDREELAQQKDALARRNDDLAHQLTQRVGEQDRVQQENSKLAREKTDMEKQIKEERDRYNEALARQQQEAQKREEDARRHLEAIEARNEAARKQMEAEIKKVQEERDRYNEALTRQQQEAQKPAQASSPASLGKAPPSSPTVPSVAPPLSPSIPPIAQGYEEIYRRFLRGKLIYTDPNTKGKLELPISALSNPLGGTFDLSRCGDTGNYLSISTGYRKGKNPQNANKTEIWFAPRFLIERNISGSLFKSGSAKHFKPIMDQWNGKAAPVGIFWTWGGWDNLDHYDYLSSETMDDLGTQDLYEKYKKAAGAAASRAHDGAVAACATPPTVYWAAVFHVMFLN